jgi:uncharacterized protein YheU (UPF0270 family)
VVVCDGTNNLSEDNARGLRPSGGQVNKQTDPIEEHGLEVPYERLEAEVLQAIMEEYVLREGTDYGECEYSLAQKVEKVRKQLLQGKIVLLFDPETESINLSPRI